MYTRAPKESASTSRTSTPKKSNASETSHSFSIQPHPETHLAPVSEAPSYSRNAADLLSENIMRSLSSPEPEPEAAPAALEVTPTPQLPTPSIQPKEIAIQRQCTDCAEEQQEQSENEEKSFDEISSIQTKPTIGAPGDQYEQEADKMAAQVMSMSVTPQVQRFLEAENPVQMRSLAQSITPVVQTQVNEQVQMQQLIQRAFQPTHTQASGDLESRLSGSKGGGSPLSQEVRSFMEPRFGADFSQVRVHTGSEAVQMNRELGAQAFTHGSDVYFGAGKSPGNNELTAHELTHVVQQTGNTFLNTSIQRSREEQTYFQVTGRYIAVEGNLIVDINQAGRAIVGQYENSYTGYARQGELRRGTIEGEVAWDNEGSTGFQFQVTPQQPSSDRSFSGRMIFSAGGHLRIVRDTGEVHRLTRSSTSAFIPEGNLTGFVEVDRVAVGTPLLPAQRQQIEQLRSQVEEAVRQFYSSSVRAVQSSAISTLNRQIREIFHSIPATQKNLFRTELRTELATEITVQGFRWSHLDWLQAVCMQLEDPDVARDIEEQLGIRLGSRSLGDGDTIYRYRIRIYSSGVERDSPGIPISGGIHGGIMRITAAQPYRRGENSTPPPFEQRWERNYTVSWGAVSTEVGASDGLSSGEVADGIVESPFPWEPLDFQGPLGGGGVTIQAGTEGLLGGRPFGFSDESLSLRGSGIYPPLDLSSIQSQIIGQQGRGSIEFSAVGGYAVDLNTTDSTIREPIVNHDMPRSRYTDGVAYVHLAFSTASHDLTSQGRAALRRVLALNRRILEGTHVQLLINGHASRRRRSPNYDNLGLSQRRADTVASACREILDSMVLAPRIVARGLGTTEAEANSRAPDDNHKHYRRADVSINGVVVLRLYGDATSDSRIQSDEGTFPSEDPDS